MTSADVPFSRLVRRRNRAAAPDPSDKRVLFVLMPWAGVRSGGLGIATLKAILQQNGIRADCIYPNVQFSEAIGSDIYQFIGTSGASRFGGEIFFTQRYFDAPLDDFLRETLRPYYDQALKLVHDVFTRELVDASIATFHARCEAICRSHIPAFFDALERSVDWDDYDIIGFSSMFQQRLASLCMARWIKANFPEKKILFGGSSCFSEMGVETVRSFPEVDVVATGEADEIIVPLVRAIRAGAPLDAIPGLAFRHNGQVIETGAAPVLTDLDWLPIPDYEDYIRAVRRRGHTEISVYFETSRGCWWGQKHLCSFCGLNAKGLAYRRKSPERALAEIREHAARWGVTRLWCADNILDLSYFKNVIPELARHNAALSPGERLSFAYEIKSNLKKSQFELLKQAGINEIQPGIESFSDHVLRLMKKGATGIQQVQCLKWATEFRIDVTYGVLHSNPGEAAHDYDEMAGLVDFISHLPPPSYVTPTTLDRFSPYHTTPDVFDIRNIRPRQGDEKTFPRKDIDLSKLMYSFDYDHADRDDAVLQAAIARCAKRLNAWRDGYRPDTLIYQTRSDGVYILDRRGAPRAIVLRGLQADVFRYCDEIRRFESISAAWPEVPPERIRAFLDVLVEHKWMMRDPTAHYLSLPVRRELVVADGAETSLISGSIR